MYKGKRYKRRKNSKEFSDTGLDFEEVKPSFEEVNTRGIKVSAGIKEINACSLDVNTSSDPVATDSIRVSVPFRHEKTKRKILQEEARLAEAIRLDALEKALEKEEVAKQVHLDSLLAQRMAEEQELTEEQKKRKAQAWKWTQLEKLNFEEVKAEFWKNWFKQLDTMSPYDFERTKECTKSHYILFRVAIKSPSIANYKIIKQGRKGVYQIVRENGTDMVYISFRSMLTDISRDDLTELYRIVMRKHGMNKPEDEFEKVLWEYLKNMFEEPLSTDSIWSLPGQQRLICWRYYDACRVHCLNLESVDVYMLIERKYPLSAEVCKAMLDKKLQGGKPDEDCYKLLKMMEKQAGIRNHEKAKSTDKEQREPTFQVVMDALALTLCYSAFLTTVDVPKVYMHQLWDSIHKYDTSYREIKSISDVVVDSDAITFGNFFSPEEPTRKSKRVKRPAKKSTNSTTVGVVIRDTPLMSLSKKKEKVTVEKGKGIDLLSEVEFTEEAQYEEVRKKSLRDFHKTHPSGSGTVTKIALSAANIKPSITNKGTGAKPGVLDVTEEESTESKAES
ncbi:hypothetical protein Tco_1492183 [Tanacetum coccineum]